MLIGAVPGQSTTLILTKGDPNDCIQNDYRLVCPLPLDPNLIAIGPIIPPVSFDPNDPNGIDSWTIDHGKYNDELFPCDPDNDPMVVEVIATNTLGAAIVVDPNDRVLLTAECREPGFVWWHLRVTDVPEASDAMSQDVVMVANVRKRENRAPSLN